MRVECPIMGIKVPGPRVRIACDVILVYAILFWASVEAVLTVLLGTLF